MCPFYVVDIGRMGMVGGGGGGVGLVIFCLSKTCVLLCVLKKMVGLDMNVGICKSWLSKDIYLRLVLLSDK
jgi:hypothetical protein